jgi:hypothetical protein
MKSTFGFALLGAMALGSGTAQAQSFTFESKNDPGTTVGTTAPDGSPVIGVYGTGTSSITWPDGKKTVDKYACVSMTQPPHDTVFAVHMICDGKSANGDYTVIAGCQFQNAQRTELGCSGGMWGKSGMYAGKRGGITWSGSNNASTGVGQWGK